MAVLSPSHVRLWFACSLMSACVDHGAQGKDDAGSDAQTGELPALTLPPEVFVTETGGASTGGGALSKLDLPQDPTETDGAAPPATGCEKVDFLFVIDNSNSMADEQTSLVASFPGFIAAIEQTVAAKDYHIMAISTDKGEGDGGEDSCDFQDCICIPAPNCCQDVCDGPFNKTCNGVSCDQMVIDECEFKYGSGRVHDLHGATCGIADGRRYMLHSQENLTQTFECVATIGALGSGDEKPMTAAVAALGAKLNEPGGCNEGFLRDDAILVLVIITDEEDDNIEGEGSYGEPSEWYESVVAAKLGVPSAAVVLGLVGDGNLIDGVCPLEWDPDLDGGEPAPRLQAFVEMFEHGTLGSVCAADYAPFFLEAVSVIDTACDDFVPVG